MKLVRTTWMSTIFYGLFYLMLLTYSYYFRFLFNHGPLMSIGAVIGLLIVYAARSQETSEMYDTSKAGMEFGKIFNIYNILLKIFLFVFVTVYFGGLILRFSDAFDIGIDVSFGLMVLLLTIVVVCGVILRQKRDDLVRKHAFKVS